MFKIWQMVNLLVCKMEGSRLAFFSAGQSIFDFLKLMQD